MKLGTALRFLYPTGGHRIRSTRDPELVNAARLAQPKGEDQ
jgi:hypothetical protein